MEARFYVGDLMTLFRIAALAGMAALLAAPAMAQDKPVDLKPYDKVWADCQATIGDGTGGWSGWHSIYEGGYANMVEFYDASDVGVSAMVENQSVDAIVYITTTSCFRQSNGQLAIIKTTMTGPNMASGSEEYPALTRYGEVYYDETGSMAANLGWIEDEAGKKFKLDDPKYMLARGCNTVDLRNSVDDARKQVDSVLGDLEGTRPAYTPNPYDWCVDAKFPK